MAKLKLQDRERRMLIWGGIAAAAIMIYVLGDTPLQAFNRSEQSLSQAQDRLKQAQSFHDIVVRNREEQAILREKFAGKSGFDLLTFVNGAVRDRGLSARASIDNSGRAVTGSSDLASVRVGLKGVSLEELIDFLYDIYGSDNLVVLHELDQLVPASDKKGLDCQMVLVAPRGA